MDPSPFLDRVLDDEGLTAGLDEPEAMRLVRAVADRVRALAGATSDAAAARRRTDELCRAGRRIAEQVARAPAPDRPALLDRLLAAWPG